MRWNQPRGWRWVKPKGAGPMRLIFNPVIGSGRRMVQAVSCSRWQWHRCSNPCIISRWLGHIRSLSVVGSGWCIMRPICSVNKKGVVQPLHNSLFYPSPFAPYCGCGGNAAINSSHVAASIAGLTRSFIELHPPPETQPMALPSPPRSEPVVDSPPQSSLAADAGEHAGGTQS